MASLTETTKPIQPLAFNSEDTSTKNSDNDNSESDSDSEIDDESFLKLSGKKDKKKKKRKKSKKVGVKVVKDGGVEEETIVSNEADAELSTLLQSTTLTSKKPILLIDISYGWPVQKNLGKKESTLWHVNSSTLLYQEVARD